jgi:glycosyltransferase involved in cell wall biosynthesis
MIEDTMPADVKVSIVVPAHNAVATIAETLDSVLAQTFGSWEAIVVDDGSTDGTTHIAADFSSRDPRIRVVTQAQRGECGARNTGVRLSRFEWLLFLDSDDWVVPEYLERMTNALRLDPKLDAVHCRWARVIPDGRRTVSSEEPGSGDLFSLLAVRNPFAVHACVVRRSLVMAVGAFDESLPTAGDWDLWQKVARTGARFGRLDDVMALYRVRAGSLSSQASRLLTDGLRVIERGHRSDARVPVAIAAHHDGQSRRDLASTRFYMLAWCAGVLLGRDEDATALIGQLGSEREPKLSATNIAKCIFDSVPLATCRAPDDWVELWPRLDSRIARYLEALEAQSEARGLARRALVALEGLIIAHGAQSRRRGDDVRPDRTCPRRMLGAITPWLVKWAKRSFQGSIN